ncbi:hypothetical protein K438DRAFT_1978594 [Mycena galopus ATCC 62051]|nr:hypothetical protein K438DRAFT_1978594 [Mycena galopus ATCC 62051]
MAAWSTAKRNGLAADYIINMEILEKYWKYGFNTSNVYTHTSRLSLDNFDETTPPPTRTFPAPTLHDLLNPIPLAPNPSEATLFDNPDPYGHQALEDDEDDALDQNVPPPIIIRSSDARRLAIEILVNLEAPALLARLNPPTMTKPSTDTSTARSTPPVPQKEKWTAKNASWGNDSGGW